MARPLMPQASPTATVAPFCPGTGGARGCPCIPLSRPSAGREPGPSAGRVGHLHLRSDKKDSRSRRSAVLSSAHEPRRRPGCRYCARCRLARQKGRREYGAVRSRAGMEATRADQGIRLRLSVALVENRCVASVGREFDADLFQKEGTAATGSEPAIQLVLFE